MPSSLFPNQPLMTPMQPSQVNMIAPQPSTMGTTQGTGNREQILQMWQTMKNSSNPQELMQQLVNSNPQFKQLMDVINSSGDPQKLFYAMAQKQGVDPESILSLLK